MVRTPPRMILFCKAVRRGGARRTKMTFIHWTVSREVSPNSLLKIRTRAARRWLLWTARVLAVFIAISMPAAHATMLYAQPYRAGGYLLPLLWLLATGFALLAAALAVHAYEQRSSIARLAAAIEQRSSTGTLPQS